jgi:hypothetical protein
MICSIVKTNGIRVWTLFIVLALAGCGSGSSTGSSSNHSGGGTGGSGGSGGGAGGSSTAPQIQLVSPSKVMLGVPIGTVTLYGKNFTADAQVFIDGIATNTFFQNSGNLEAEIGLSLDQVAAVHQLSVHEMAGISGDAPFRIYAPMQGPQPFSVAAGYSAGPEMDPSAITVADLDGNGADSVILAGPELSGGPSLAILNGQADGTLAPVSYVAGVSAASLASGDVNGDGKVDVVAVGGNGVVTALLNQGGGNFTQVPSSTYSGSFAGPAALADMYGSGSLDLVFAVESPNSILLFKNGGGGTFDAPQTIATIAGDNRNFSVADFNNDGRPDIVYTGINSSTGADQLHILLNQGGGSFSDTIPASLSGVTGYVSVIDANNDGCPDLAVQSPTDSTAPVVLQIFLGHCDGTFALASSTTIAPGGFAPYHLVAGDFDNDGFPDLAGVNGETEPSHILYLWGDGTGNFTPQQVNGPMGFIDVTGDVNGDGIPDMIVPDRFNEVSVSLGRNDRNVPSALSLAPYNAGGVSIADVNGDGLPDLFFAGNFVTGAPGTVFLNSGDGQFVLSGTVTPFGLMIADVNGDGLADLIGVDGPNLAVWPGTGDPNFSGSPIVTDTPSSASVEPTIQVADVDGDGHPDVIASGSIFFGAGNFQFSPVTIPLSAPLAIGDFNGDGKLDLAGPAQTLLNQGNRQFTSVQSNLNMTVWPGTTPVVADFNGDGMLDVAWVNSESPSYVEISDGQGDGTFYLQGAVTGGQYAGGIAVGDFNGDGRPDILTGLMFAQQMVLYTNDGQGGFEASYFASGANTTSLACADFNHDGKTDVVIVNFGEDFRPPNALVIFGK